MLSCFHSLGKYLLATYYEPGTVLGAFLKTFFHLSTPQHMHTPAILKSFLIFEQGPCLFISRWVPHIMQPVPNRHRRKWGTERSVI